MRISAAWKILCCLSFLQKSWLLNLGPSNKKEEVKKMPMDNFDFDSIVPPMKPSRRDNFINPDHDDIEIIDLDNGREQIKPTTWHR